MRLDLTEPADQVFGKLMSISDELMWHYMHIFCINLMLKLRSIKNRLLMVQCTRWISRKAWRMRLLRVFGQSEEADAAQAQFEALFQKKDYSQAVEVAIEHKEIWIVDLLKALNAIGSSSEAKRLIETKSVHVDGNAD